MRARNLGSLSTLKTVREQLQSRAAEVVTETIDLADLKVHGNNVFSVKGTELVVPEDDELPVKQLCGIIGMNHGFYKANPGALNTNIFDTRFRGMADTEAGQRIIRYRRTLEGNRLLSLLPLAYKGVSYPDVLSPVIGALPDDTIIRHMNPTSVDDDHRFSLRATFPSLELRAPGAFSEDDPIEVGLFIDMSEDGLGKFRLTSMLFQLVCSNGAMVEYDRQPLLSWNYRGIAGPDFGAAALNAFGRFRSDMAYFGHRVAEARAALLNKDEALDYLRGLENRRDFSRTFLRGVRKELDAREISGVTRWQALAEVTLQAQRLPYTQRVNHEFAVGRVLGLSLTSPTPEPVAA